MTMTEKLIGQAERCNVVELMRGEAADFRRLGKEHDYAWTVDLGDVPAIFQDITHYVRLDGVVCVEEIFDRLADFIDLPTCRNVSGYQDVFECSECRCKVELITEVCNEYGEPFSVSFTPSFCPECGAAVMDNE